MFSNLEYYKNSGLYDIEKEVQVIEYEENGVLKKKKRVLFRPVRKAPAVKVTVLKGRKKPFIPLFEDLKWETYLVFCFC